MCDDYNLLGFTFKHWEMLTAEMLMLSLSKTV